MLELFGHPFSSYTWKALIALYENATPFVFRDISGTDHPENEAAFLRHWPVGKFPLLVDAGQPVMESSTIIEHLDVHYPGAVRFIPDDRAAAIEVRMLDRVFDNHVMALVQRAVMNALQPPDQRNPNIMASISPGLDSAYGWINDRLAPRKWAAGDNFSLADCAGAPALFYADWVHPIADRFSGLKGYRARVLARPSVARCVEEARPYRHYFPLGAPDRD